MVHASQSLSLPAKVKRYTRCRSRKESSSPQCTAAPAAYDFLRHRFDPAVAQLSKELDKERKVQKEFFRSLKNLSGLYSFSLPAPDGLVYPYNLYCCFNYAKACVEEQNPLLELRLIQDERHTACLCTAFELRSEFDLCYIPVKPLSTLSQERKTKPVFSLLLSLYSLLYRKGVTSFTDGGMLHYHYDMITEWIESSEGEWEEDEYRLLFSDCNGLKWFGKKVMKQIQHPYHAAQFEKRIAAFWPVNSWEEEVKSLCLQFRNLFTAYPDAHFHRNIFPLSDSDEDGETAGPDAYLSFVWSNDDRLYDSLMENIYSTLNECSCFLRPAALQYFDKPQTAAHHDLYFEWRFLLLLDTLCDLLNRLP